MRSNSHNIQSCRSIPWTWKILFILCEALEQGKNMYLFTIHIDTWKFGWGYTPDTVHNKHYSSRWYKYKTLLFLILFAKNAFHSIIIIEITSIFISTGVNFYYLYLSFFRNAKYWNHGAKQCYAYSSKYQHNAIDIIRPRKQPKEWTMKKYLYPHGQFGTQVQNNHFNYCKVIMQSQQYFNQLWAVV